MENGWCAMSTSLPPDGTDRVMWELERVWTHRTEDRTIHHIKADDKRHAENRLSRLERRGETDDLGNEINSQGGEPLHTHVYRAPQTETDHMSDSQ